MISTKPIVMVRWDDANSSSIKVLTEQQTEYHAPVVMETIGWLLRDDKRGVSVVSEAFVEDGITNYRGHTFIPRGMVLSVETLTIGKRKRR